MWLICACFKHSTFVISFNLHPHQKNNYNLHIAISILHLSELELSRSYLLKVTQLAVLKPSSLPSAFCPLYTLQK